MKPVRLLERSLCLLCALALLFALAACAGPGGTPTPTEDPEPDLSGFVVSIEDNITHPLYKKVVKNTIRLKAHDENNECGVGDTVRVMETRPLSKDKRWRLVEIIEKAKSFALS